MKRGFALGWLALVLIAACYLSLRIYQGLVFQTDVMSLLPQAQQDAATQAATDAVTHGFTRQVVILVGDKDRNAARSAASGMMSRFFASGLFDSTTPSLDKDHLRQIGAFYYPYRAGLLSDEDRDRLKAGDGAELAERALAQTFSVMGMADARLLRADPFLLMPDFLTHLPVPLSRFAPDDGLLTMRDKEETWVLIAMRIKGEAFALDTQKQVVDVFDRVVAAQKANVPDIDILHLGAVFFAKASAEKAMAETSAIGVVSTLGVVLLMLVVFRAARPLLLSLLVIGVGITVALASCLWLFGTLHVMSLLFGVSLIGVASDYTLQYCTEVFATPPGLPAQRLQRVVVGVSLGAATTIIGYLTLYLAPFPGLHQIAAFSAIGLFAALVTVIVWVPMLDRDAYPFGGGRMIDVATTFLHYGQAPSFRWLRFGLMLVIALMAVVGLYRFHVDDDVRHMQALPAALVAEQRQVQNIIGAVGSGPFFLVQAADAETALQREEQLVDRLRPLMAARKLSGFQSVAQYIPSAARQTENRDLQREQLYRPLLAQQTAALGLATAPQMPPDAPRLGLDTASSSDGPLMWLSNLILPTKDATVSHVVMLTGVADADAVRTAARNSDGIRYMDPTDDFSKLFGKYRARAMILLALSAALMLPLLIGRYGIKRGVWIMVPPGLAVILAPVLRSCCGGAFTFFDAMALVLILSIGVDYAVFFAETSGKRTAVTMLAVAMAACTALMSFGLLALSSVAAVHNFGATMSVGIFLSFVFAPLARARASELAGSLRPLILVIFALGLNACATLPEVPPAKPVSIVSVAPQVSMVLPDPASLGRAVEATQLVTVHYGDQSFAFEAHIRATPDRFLLVALDMMGRALFRIDWTSTGVICAKSDWVPAQLQPENILADIVLLYWPTSIVRQSLAASGAIVVARSDHRDIDLHGQPVWQAEYHPVIKGNLWSGPLHYRNLAWGYSFDIQSTEATP